MPVLVRTGKRQSSGSRRQPEAMALQKPAPDDAIVLLPEQKEAA